MLMEKPFPTLQVHQQLTLRNIATRQYVWFEILDIFQYRDQSILYGERRKELLWMPSVFGHREESPGPSCFPIFPTTPAEQVVELVDQLRSLPLYLELPDERLLPILSVENAHKIFGGERGKRDDMIFRAQRLIDLYNEWKIAGVIPQWFRKKQRLAKTMN